jgi:hypothetical protein
VRAFGFECCVVAPSLIPVRAGERVKTDQLDAIRLARLLRAGERTPIRVPDETHEAMRVTTRAALPSWSDWTGSNAPMSNRWMPWKPGFANRARSSSRKSR